MPREAASDVLRKMKRVRIVHNAAPHRGARAWQRMLSGRRLDLLAPDPASWTDRDLAVGLSRTYRWGGQSCWDLPLSVAQHSLLVLVLRQAMTPLDNLTRAEALRELLHDADEGYAQLRPDLAAETASRRGV